MKRKFRELGSVLHIFCEGMKSEPNYIEHYKDLFCNTKRASIVVERTEKTTPVQLVEVAIKMKESSSVYRADEYWVVYDRESPAKYNEKLHQKARKLALEKGINIAISNVSFEVWLMLHYQSTCAACDSCEALISRKDFKQHFPGYDKAGECNFSVQEIGAARLNAERMNRQTISVADKEWTEPSMWNPYTDFYMLLDAIDRFCGK